MSTNAEAMANPRPPRGSDSAVGSGRGLGALILLGLGLGLGGLPYSAGPIVGLALEAPFLLAATIVAGSFVRRGDLRGAVLEPLTLRVAWIALITSVLVLVLTPMNAALDDHSPWRWFIGSLSLSAFIAAQAGGLWVRRRIRRVPGSRARRLASLTLWTFFASWPIGVVVSIAVFFAVIPPMN